MKNIVNIVNFVRGVEPRPGRNIDLVGTVRNEIEGLRTNGITAATFLLQYDALTDEFIRLFDGAPYELGIWLEVVEDQAKASGIEWRGRYSWDWHNDVGFLIGYEKEERYRLIDTHMQKFFDIFGYYPKSVGSWHIDAASLDYLDKKYKIDACCICRDQVGVDGYTMQGGYYNGAYYPTKNNMFCPSSDKDLQINIPVFRMLGSDAIYAYDYQVKGGDYGITRIPTLEPAAREGGGSDPKWVESFFTTTFSGNGISHQYTQAGQENSFGWQRLGAGYDMQMQKLKAWSEQGKLEIMTLGDAGRWYKDSFELTPPQTITALYDCINERYKSVWYSSRYYRAGLLWDNGRVHIRDMYIFRDELREHYLDTPCRTTACEFRNCPVTDGALYGKDSGAYLGDIVWDSLDYREEQNSAVITLCCNDGSCTVRFNERGIDIDCNIDGFCVSTVYDKGLVYAKSDKATELYCSRNNAETVISSITRASVTDTDMDFEFCGVSYGITAKQGSFTNDFNILPSNGKISIQIKG